MMDAEEKSLVWLCACTDLDYRARVILLRTAKSPENLFSAFESFLPAVIKEGETRVGASTLAQRERQAEELLASLRKKGYFAVTLLSGDYPEGLKAIPDPPLVLFGAGNRDLLRSRKFAVVGSRVTPPHAEKLCKTISAELSERFAIVTGLAEGGDCAALRGALTVGGPICVLPNGLDECYPAAHAALKREVCRKGLLLSEYAPAEKVKKYNFFARNRILAGLSEGVLVVSAGKRSGALITANRALEYGRDVFAFPYNTGVAQGEGCNGLIKNGAYLCTETEDVFSCYGFASSAKREIALTEEEQKLLSVLREAGELHTSAIAERAGMKIYEAAATLSALELKGLAVKAGGNRYSAV